MQHKSSGQTSTITQHKCLQQARRRLPTRTVCHAISVMLQVKASFYRLYCVYVA